MQDIISKLNKSGESAPSFVAKDLSSVPPLSLDFFDLAKVTRDVGKFMAYSANMSSITTILNFLQEDLRDMCSNIKSVSDDVNVLKSNSSLTCKSDPVTSDSLVSVPVVRARPATGSSERTAISSVSSLLMARPAREHAEVIAEVIAEPVSAIEPAESLVTSTPTDSDTVSDTQQHSSTEQDASGCVDTVSSMDTDFTQVRRERKSKKSFTSALQNNLTKSTVFTNSNLHQSRLPVNSKLRAAEPRVSPKNKRSALFIVTRLHKDTIAQEIEEHVKCLPKGEKVLCESIRIRFDSYSS